MDKKRVKTIAAVGGIIAAIGAFFLWKAWKSSRDKKFLDNKPDSTAASAASKPVKAESTSLFPLKVGSPKNDLVSQLQGYLGVVADGIWGSKTQTAFVSQTGKTQIASQTEFDQVISLLQNKTAAAAGKLRADDLTIKWNTNTNLRLVAIKKGVALGVSKDAYGALNLNGKNVTLGVNIPFNRADYVPMGTTTNGYLLFSINNGEMKGLYKIVSDNMSVV